MRQMQMDLICCDYAGAELGIYKVWAEPSLAAAVPTLHTHEVYEMHIVTEGTYTFTVEGECVPLRARQCLILKPGTEHYSYDKIGDCTLISLQFSLKKTKGGSGFYSYFQKALESVAGEPFTASRALIGCALSFENEPCLLTVDVYCRLQVLLAQIVYHLFSDIDRFDGEKARVKSEHRIHSVTYVIECLINDGCTLSEIADRIGYSARHTTRLIQSMYGKTLAKLRMDRSLDHAKRLLTATDKTIEEIATEAGFSGASAMRRAFLRTEGISPNEYRKSNQKETEHGTDKV